VRVVLLRVGIDTAEGGINGPLFADGGFKFVPIPDARGIDERTYGNTRGRHGRLLVEYFPVMKRQRRQIQPMHVDPDFEAFTYGDPTLPKRGLRKLQAGDLLVFYAGLQRWPSDGTRAALYIVGYFGLSVDDRR
jgi:Nucleotide modification associated domain 3